MKILGVILIALMAIFFIVPLLLFVLGIFVLVATSFLVAQLTGIPIEVKQDDVVIGHVRRFKYTSVKKDYNARKA